MSEPSVGSSQSSSRQSNEVWDEGSQEDRGDEGNDGNDVNDGEEQTERYLDLDVSKFEKVQFPKDIVKAVQALWGSWTSEIGSKEASGEAFYTALFDAAPSLQLMFKSPKAAMRFMEGLTALVNSMGNSTALFKEVEALGFRHLDIEVTSIRATFFREALMDTIDDQVSAEDVPLLARAGLHALLNYAGSAFCYIRREYAGRINTILRSWNVVQKSATEDFLKQSATRINFIGDKVVGMTLEMYRTPRHMVEAISALGLRHVGYAVPTEMLVVEAFRWSLALVAKILVRSITEGSTLVMKAINTNNKLTLTKAMDVSARGQRANDLLSITVGTQSISPFYWSIDSGSLHGSGGKVSRALICAQTILEDLLTIRADRDVYYYGCDNLFTRHPEVIKRICTSAPSLLPTFLDGLVWRSRQTNEGKEMQ
eukprot:Skav212178  [mRNA]  locus=scaffold754:392548:402202:+ [translate_table: standard]